MKLEDALEGQFDAQTAEARRQAKHRLREAAPELLAALKEAVESLDSAEAESHAEYCSPQHSWRECGEGIRPQHLIARLEALIARVEGGK